MSDCPVRARGGMKYRSGESGEWVECVAVLDKCVFSLFSISDYDEPNSCPKPSATPIHTAEAAACTATACEDNEAHFTIHFRGENVLLSCSDKVSRENWVKAISASRKFMRRKSSVSKIAQVSVSKVAAASSTAETDAASEKSHPAKWVNSQVVFPTCMKKRC